MWWPYKSIFSFWRTCIAFIQQSPDIPRLERDRTIIDNSFQLALSRGLIYHVLPITTSALLIAVNCKKVYLGPALEFGSWTTTYSLAAFQVAAKLQELLDIASMTKVIFDIIRYELLHGEGLALHLMTSGFTFSGLGFLCSKATWIWMWSAPAKGKRALIVFCVLVFALLALLIGPASAVLILPRLNDQDVYNPRFWMYGSSDDLFPTMLTAAYIGSPISLNSSDPSACNQPSSHLNDHCISRAYQKMQNLFDNSWNISHEDWSFIARENTFAREVKVHEHIETWARTPHVATGFVQNILWWDFAWLNKFNSGRVSIVKSKAPNVRTACHLQTIASDTSEIQFPRLESFKTYRYDSTASVAIQPGIWSQNNVSFAGPDLVRTIWIDGAQNIDAVTAGLIILAPLMNSNDTSRSALACSIDARWDESYHVQSDGPLDNAITVDVVGPRHDDGEGSGFLPTNNSGWKNIKANMDWLEALTPTSPFFFPPLNMTSPVSTIAILLMSTDHAQFATTKDDKNEFKANPYHFWEFVVAAYFADGVARVGYAQQLESAAIFVERPGSEAHPCVFLTPPASLNLDVCPEDRPKGVNLTAFSLQGRITNIYAYQATSKTDFLSIAVVSLYILIAASHLLYSLICRRSSRAWENLEDLLALAHSSRPDPKVLSNTCAGIQRAHTKATNVRILVKGGRSVGKYDEEDEEAGRKQFVREEEEVQMVFVDEMNDGTMYGEVQPGEKYGKMA